MKTLREILTELPSGKAIGHFNVSDSTQLNGIFEIARELNVPVIIGVSEGEADYFGLHQVAAIVASLRSEHNFPIYLNADHVHSIEGCTRAIDAGFDAVIFDGVKLPEHENSAGAKAVVEYARSCGRDVLVEAELGYIGTSSKVLDEVPEGAGLDMTTPELAQRFVSETGIDLLAPSVGNIHGMLKNVPEPRLDVPRIKAISEATRTPLVLHGGSGTSDEDFRAAIEAGINIVHINTEIRVAYRKGIETALAADPDEVAPYKYLAKGKEAMNEVVRSRLQLFMHI